MDPTNKVIELSGIDVDGDLVTVLVREEWPLYFEDGTQIPPKSCHVVDLSGFINGKKYVKRLFVTPEFYAMGAHKFFADAWRRLVSRVQSISESQRESK